MVSTYGPRSLQSPVGLAFLTGCLLWFAGTDLAWFEGLVLVAALGTTIYVLIGRHNIIELANKQDYLLLALTALLVGQTLYFNDNQLWFGLTTLYLFSVYFLVRFWREQKAGWLIHLITGYLASALVMSLFALIIYGLAVLSFALPLPGFSYSVRWLGFLDDPVVFGALLVPAVIIFGYYAIYSTLERRYWLNAGAAWICFAVLILTGSRGAWLNLVAAALIVAMMKRNIWHGQQFTRAFIISAIALLVALTLIYLVPLQGKSYYSATLDSRFVASDAPRLNNLKLAPAFIINRPWFNILLGSGSGSYEHFSDKGFSAHNTFLRVLFEQGVMGLGLFVSFLYLYARAILRHRSDDHHKAVLVAAVLGGVIIQSLFVDTLHWRHWWVVLAWL